MVESYYVIEKKGIGGNWYEEWDPFDEIEEAEEWLNNNYSKKKKSWYRIVLVNKTIITNVRKGK